MPSESLSLLLPQMVPFYCLAAPLLDVQLYLRVLPNDFRNIASTRLA